MVTHACVAPEELKPGDLMACVEGRAALSVVRHVSRCSACAAELKVLADGEAQVTAALFRSRCPDGETLLLYQSDLLDALEKDAVRRHILTCQYCPEELGELASEELTPVSPASNRKPVSERIVNRIQQLGRELLVGVRLAVEGSGLVLRGEQSSSRRYQAGPYELLVACMPPSLPGQPWEVSGQLVGADPAVLESSEAQLLRGEAIVSRDSLDEFATFLLSVRSLDGLSLRLELPEATILIDALGV